MEMKERKKKEIREKVGAKKRRRKILKKNYKKIKKRSTWFKNLIFN